MPAISLNDRAVKALRPGPDRQLFYDTTIKGFGLRLDPSGAGAFFYQYRPWPGTRREPVRRLKIGALGKMTAAAARAEAKRLQGQVAEKRDPWAEKEDLKRRRTGDTLRQAVDAFLAARAADARPRTLGEYRKALNRHLVGKRGATLLVDLTASELTKALAAVKAPVAKARAYAAFSVFLNWCRDEGRLTGESPLAAVPKPRERARERDRTLAPDELADLWRAAEGLGWPFGRATQLLILLGQRRAETAGLRWSELDLEANVWTIPPSRAKSGRAHRVPLPPAALAVIDSLPRQQDAEGELIDLAFTVTGKTPVSGWTKAKRALDAAIAKARKKRGADPMPSWTLHDCRRTVASQLAEIGIDPGIIDRVLNHAASHAQKGMRRIYLRYEFDREKRAALTAWAARVERLVTPQVGSNVVPLDRAG